MKTSIDRYKKSLSVIYGSLDSDRLEVPLIDSIRAKIINLYSIITVAIFCLVGILSLLTNQPSRLFDLIPLTLGFPLLVSFFLYTGRLNKARYALVISSFLVIAYIAVRRLQEGVDSHVEINVIQLCLIAHLLFDGFFSWILIIGYIILFVAIRLITIFYLGKPFDQDDFIHELLSILIVSYSSYAAKKYIKDIQLILTRQSEGLFAQKNDLEKSNLYKDKLFNILSHDLRSPVSSVKILLENLADQYKEKTEIRYAADYVDKVYLNLDNLLHWSRLQRSGWKLYFSETDINSIVSAILTNFMRDVAVKQVDIAVDLAPVRLYSDEYLLEIILRNIIQNAIKFSHTGGKIHIRSRLLDTYCYISIEDFGVGMPDDVIKSIADGHIPSTKGTLGEKGTGIGLEICNELAKLLQGALTFRSNPGKGTIVTVCIPVNRQH
ncbi:sensor histidine kinase [Arsenicibacter rosenii]|uniref:histidine kinase n=1 Tax=Arsenicibacter rosenii TaxID=1750698 RepID=A0A1S2VB34_9BACT|nr:HAMP domain-containing sensor histidine kinase [Arsenicibacter rosenii]OIN55931.1 hypothetical protein BLX24_27195 [Arsenicibacter rosenii]